MNYFKLPLGLCNDVESLIHKFWRGQKCDGSMGFKDLALFNDTLLAKQAWRLLHNITSLFYRVFKSKFFPHCSILEAVESQSGSYA